MRSVSDEMRASASFELAHEMMESSIICTIVSFRVSFIAHECVSREIDRSTILLCGTIYIFHVHNFFTLTISISPSLLQ